LFVLLFVAVDVVSSFVVRSFGLFHQVFVSLIYLFPS
jgi:hypothetical protein